MIGDRIKKLRKARGLTQQKLAEKVGIVWRYVQSIEAGKSNPSLKTLKKIAEALEVPLADLMEDDANEGIETIIRELKAFDDELETQLRKVKDMRIHYKDKEMLGEFLKMWLKNVELKQKNRE